MPDFLGGKRSKCGCITDIINRSYRQRKREMSQLGHTTLLGSVFFKNASGQYNRRIPVRVHHRFFPAAKGIFHDGFMAVHASLDSIVTGA